MVQAEQTEGIRFRLCDIAMDVRNALDKAVWYIGMYLEYRKDYYELRDIQKDLIRLEFKKKMARKKAGD